MTAPVLQAVTIVIVLAFLSCQRYGCRRKGFLRKVPKVTGLRTQVTIVFSVGVGLAFATIPYWW